MQNEKETSQITYQLNTRIQTNKKFGSVDLDEWLFEKLNLRNGCNILDVGCGTGNHLLKLAGLFPEGRYYGIDVSKNSIEEAKQKSISKNLDIAFICGDASDTSTLHNNFFDLIMSIYALYYVKNPEKLLSILKTKLKKNGRIAVMSPYKKNNDEWYNFLSSFMEIPKEVESVSEKFMDEEVIPFAKANFNSIETSNFENKITIPSYNDLKNYWLSNIYQKPEFNSSFKMNAKDFLKKNKVFVITKRALLVVMS